MAETYLKKPFIKKRTYPTNHYDEYDDDDVSDVNALEDEQVTDDIDDDDYGYGVDDDAEDYEDDLDQVAYVDEEGFFHVDKETIKVVDEMLAWEDEEYAQLVTTYIEAHKALAQARIAQ